MATITEELTISTENTALMSAAVCQIGGPFNDIMLNVESHGNGRNETFSATLTDLMMLQDMLGEAITYIQRKRAQEKRQG